MVRTKRSGNCRSLGKSKIRLRYHAQVRTTEFLHRRWISLFGLTVAIFLGGLVASTRFRRMTTNPAFVDEKGVAR
jgi:hypothetical protein